MAGEGGEQKRGLMAKRLTARRCTELGFDSRLGTDHRQVGAHLCSLVLFSKLITRYDCSRQIKPDTSNQHLSCQTVLFCAIRVRREHNNRSTLHHAASLPRQSA